MRRCTAVALLTLGLALGACAGPGTSSLTPSDPPGTTAALKARPSERPAEAPPARKAATVKVGLMLPLSGPGQAALIAETMKHAAELALVEAKTPHVTLIVRDDKATPEGATAAAQDLASQGVEVILGPLFARSVQAAAGSLRQANIPLVAFSNDRQVAGQGVALVSFLAEPEVQRVVAYAASKGKKRYAALIPADAYGRLVETAFRAAVGRHAGQIVAIESYPPDQANAMAEAVRKLRDGLRGLEEHGDPVDALFLPGGEETLAAVSPHLKQNQFDLKRMQVLGTGAMDFAHAGRDPQLLGAWFAAPDPKGWQAFSDRFASRHGHAPPRIASLAYDAVVLAAALSNGPDGARYIPGQLSRASGFDGIDGTFRIASDGTAERPLAVLEVQAFGAKVIEAQPSQGLSPSPANPVPTAKQPAGGVLSSIPSAFPQTN